jgi:curved DNA-binding protein CbpA
MPADLYDVLGVPDDASAEELKRAYRGRVREYHPDQNDHPDGDAQFKLVKTANDVLSDPAERKTYDRLGHREYVEKHLDGLPPVSVFPDDALPDDSTTDESTASGATTDSTATSTTSTATDTSGSRTTGSRTTDSGASSGSSSTASSRDGYGSAGTDNSSSTDRSSSSQSSSGRSSSTTQSSTEARSATEGASNDTDSQTTTAGADRSSWDAATNTAQSATTESTVSAGERRRRGLKRWYGVVAAALLVYLGGLGAYAYPRLGALQSFVGEVTASPVSALTGAFPLVPPSEYVVDAVRAATAGTPALGLLLLAGTILLPLVVLTAIGQFGRGAAWLYALPSLGPAVCLAVWSVVAVPTAVALLGLVVLPVLSGSGFLVDVGRYLRATR